MWWFGKRAKRVTPPDVQEELARLRLEERRARVTILKSLASNPATYPYVVAELLPRAGRMLAGDASGPNDRYTQLVDRLIQQQLSRDPRKELLETLAFLRGVASDLPGLLGESEPEEPLLVQLAKTPAGVQLAQAFAPLAAEFARAVQASARQPVQQPATRVDEVPGLDRPHADQPPTSALTPEQVLAELEGRSPEDAARRTLELALASPELRQVLEQALALPRPAVRPALEQVARSGSPWAPVAAWLVEHDAWREAWLDALQQLAAAPAEPAPNGHAATARRMGL